MASRHAVRLMEARAQGDIAARLATMEGKIDALMAKAGVAYEPDRPDAAPAPEDIAAAKSAGVAVDHGGPPPGEKRATRAEANPAPPPAHPTAAPHPATAPAPAPAPPPAAKPAPPK